MTQILYDFFQGFYLRFTHPYNAGGHGAKFPLGQSVQELDILKALSGVDMSLVSGEAHMAWMKELAILNKTAEQITGSTELEPSRQAFIELSNSMITVVKTFGTSGTTPIYRFHCPMADNNKGADWLQNTSELENPFFGSSMFKCGELVETLVK